MVKSVTDEKIEQIESLLAQLKQQPKESMQSPLSYQRVENLKQMVHLYCKTHSITLNDFALLADIGRATLTRTMQDPNNSNVKSIQAVLSVMGKELYIGGLGN